jgi:CRISPR-associated protein Cas1
VTHAAIKACSDSNTPICWIGADGMRFYAFGATPNFDNARALHQAEVHASKTRRAEVARRMFVKRFPGVDVMTKSVEELRGMEGKRVKALYSAMGLKYGVTWKGRQYDKSDWDLADNINRTVSAAHAALYALCTAVICSLGYLPQLGFVHQGGTMPFVFDMADMYKAETSLEAAFRTVSVNPEADEKAAVTLLKTLIEQQKILQRMPKEIEELLA